MRYALIFAGVAAAYDAYGYDSYSDNTASSSAPSVKYSSSVPAYGGYGENSKTSSAPVPSKASSSSMIGHATITPGYGKQPVTVTSQYQPYPTCGAPGSDGKSCDMWNEGKYVSTVINDCDSKKVTVTDVEKPITVYHTKATITHYPTPSSAGGMNGKAYPTGSYDQKNGTKTWYEMYEKVHEIQYKDLGAHGLPGYGGSGLCQSCDDEQPYMVKEYKNGKWSEYSTTAVYKAPTPETKTYSKPGVYTESAKDVTVSYTMTKPSEATTTAKAGVPITYGGVTTEFKETGVKTCAYGAYETGKDMNGKAVTSSVVKTVTVTVSTTGKYEVAKPTTTVYDHDAQVTYPTVSVYQPGIYHKDAQTVTITKSGGTYSCDYKQTKTFPAGSSMTPVHDNEYPHGGMSSSVPSAETKTKSMEYSASSVPAYGNGYPHGAMSSSMPSAETKTKSMEYSASSVPAYGNGYPHGGKYSSAMPSVEIKTSVEYQPEYPASTPSVPSMNEHKPYPAYPESNSAPVYPATTTVPHYENSKSTPCPSSTKPIDNGYKSSSVAYPEYPAASSSAPAYHPAAPSSAPGYKASSVAYPEYPAASSSAPAYHPAASSSAPAYDSYPTPTPAKYTDNKPSAPTPVKTSAAYPEASSGASYDAGKGYGYSKRAGVVQRRQVAVAKRSNRVVVV